MATMMSMRSAPITSSRCIAQRSVAPLGLAPLRLAGRVSSRAPASKQRISALKEVEAETEDAGAELSEKAQEYVEVIKTKWEETEEKPAVIAISVASFIAIVAASSVLDAVNKLPLFGGVFEVIGLGVSGWFAYRYLFNGSDREELKSNIEDFVKKIGAK